jgi:hypothetical protein
VREDRFDVVAQQLELRVLTIAKRVDPELAAASPQNPIFQSPPNRGAALRDPNHPDQLIRILAAVLAERPAL